jgi:hypothetical protein
VCRRPAAVLFDYGGTGVRPVTGVVEHDAAMCYEACKTRRKTCTGRIRRGHGRDDRQVRAGRGAGIRRHGTAAITLPDGLTFGAIACVERSGDVTIRTRQGTRRGHQSDASW